MGEESLGHMIKRRRETLGFSQARLGELVGRSASTIRNWERDKSTPSAPSDALALAAVLGLSETRVVEAAGFDVGDVESRLTLEQGYASLAPRGPSRASEPVESEPVPAEPTEPEPAQPEPAEPEPAQPERAEPEPAANRSSEAEAGDEPTSPAPSAAAGDAAAAEPDEAERKETSPPVEREPLAPSSAAFAAPGRRLQAVRPDTDSGDVASAAEPSVSRAARPTVLETPPPDEPSYLEDPDERQRYRARALATAAVVVFLLIVFLWSFDRTVDALGTMWDDFTGMLEL